MGNNFESIKGASSQGHHTNQACYKSGIMSPEYTENVVYLGTSKSSVRKPIRVRSTGGEEWEITLKA